MKKINVLLFIIFTLVFFTGCGQKVADEQQIQTDLEAYAQKESIVNDGEKITEATIDKRQTQKDAKTDTVWCTVQTEDERCTYKKAFVLTYSLYDEGGWILDEVSVSDRSSWVIAPLTGVNDDEISASLTGIDVTADSETWHVIQDNIKSITVDSHETDLEIQKDTVTATMAIDDLVEEASGQLIINYKFNQGRWEMESVSGIENFSVTQKPGKELNVTEDSLLDDINGQSFEYNPQEPRIYNIQEITINKDEVSDFVIEKREISSKGTSERYFCSCTLTKPNAAFLLTIEIPYSYSDGWNMQDIFAVAECSSVDIVGVWTGTKWGQICELNITEMDADGNISGSYSDKGDMFHKPYSYYVTGKINRKNLEITLEAGDIIGEKPSRVFKASNFTIMIHADTSLISGYEGWPFELTRQ